MFAGKPFVADRDTRSKNGKHILSRNFELFAVNDYRNFEVFIIALIDF
jgi:hypothetical protein